MTSTSTLQSFPEPNRDLLGTSVGTPPGIWPGVTPSTTAALKFILEDNHDRWHTFCNELRFHNHTAHTVLALWSLGAHESVLDAAYKQSSSVQRPSFASPGSIDASNWKEHLGDENYYNAYLNFFKSEIKARDSASVLEEYIFSKNANVSSTANNEDPSMANRFVAGLLHPLIHTGYGFEYGIPALVAEGIAQAAVHPGKTSKIIPASFFQTETPNEDSGSNKDNSKQPVHALTVFARVLADPQFEAGDSIDQFKFFGYTMETHGDAIKAYADQWTLDGSIEKKIEELLWLSVVVFGIGGYQRGKPFNNDFFHMHIVTSSIFLSSLVGSLSRSSQEILLRAYLGTCLVMYVGRGRPPIDIARFYDETTTNIIPPGATPSPHQATFPSPASHYSITPNPWLPTIQTTLVHPDDHLVKLQRALSHYAAVYGLKSPLYFADTELKDAEKLDGTLFVRVAILTAGKAGWIREGEGPAGFDRVGFYNTLGQGDNAIPYGGS